MVSGTVFPLSNQADEDEVIVFTVHMSLRTACTSCSLRDGRAGPGNERLVARLVRLSRMPMFDDTCSRLSMVMYHY